MCSSFLDKRGPRGFGRRRGSAERFSQTISLLFKFALIDIHLNRNVPVTADANLVSANREKITACRDIAAKAKKEERCTITVAAPGS
jgi:hypothetical protein